jgi:hypothetical protein
MANPTINYSTFVITVPQSFLTPQGGALYQLDTNALRIALRDLEDDEDGASQPVTHNHNTAVSLGGIQYARVIEILSPYTITFEETGSPYIVSLSGSNNNILEKTNLGTVQVLSNNSAGLINVVEVQVAAFDDGVSVNPTTGAAGTLYPIGTQSSPVNNIPDALTIASVRGFTNLYLTGSITIDATDDIRNFNLVGIGVTLNVQRTTITMIQGCLTSNAHFSQSKISGYQGGEAVYEDCIIDGLENAHCVYSRCGVKDGTVRGWSIKQATGLSSTHASFFKSCHSDQGTFILDRNGTDLNVGFLDFFGNLKIINQNHPTPTGVIWINMRAGVVTIDASCTTGQFFISGTCEVINNGTAAVDVSQVQAPGALTNDQAARLTRIEKWLRNKRVTDPVTGKQTVFDDDGSTILGEGDLFEDAAGSQPYRGQGAERAERLA